MKYFNELNKIKIDAPTVVAIGKFDGLHLGHRKLVDKMLSLKEELGAPYETCVFLITGATCGEPIYTPKERITRMQALGIDNVVECRFTDDLRTMSAEDFLKNVLLEKIGAKYIVAGPDLRFGYQGIGDVDFLRKYEKQESFELIVIDKLCYKGSEISSTRIKQCFQSGNEEDAKAMLGE